MKTTERQKMKTTEKLKRVRKALDRYALEELFKKAREYNKRVRKYEAQGMTRSDAQGVVDAEDKQ